MTEAQIAMTPEERLTANLCAECCADLTILDANHHASTHWPVILIPNGYNTEAIRRQTLMADYAENQTTKRKEEAAAKKHESEHPTGSRTTTTPSPSSARESSLGEKR